MLEAARGSPHLQFAGVASRDAAKASELAATFGGRVYADYAELLADPSVEAVVLATPHFLHHAQVMQALRSGKHVFVEKPIATTLAEGEEMAASAHRAGLVLAVGHQGRHTGGVRRAKEMLATGEFGAVASVVVVQGYPHLLFSADNDWRKVVDNVPGGQLDELAVHYFDVLQFLFGPVRRVSGFVQRPAADAPPAAASAALEFAGGVLATYTTYATSVGISRMTIYGSKGALELNRMGQDPSSWQPVADMATSRTGGVAPQPFAAPGPLLLSTALTAELEDFARAIRENRAPQVGAPESLSTLRISRAIMESAATGRTIEPHAGS